MADLIDRQMAIDAVRSYYDECDEREESIEERIERLPSADIDMSDFSDKLWKAAYERGKAEAVRHGHWIRGSGYPHHIFCSICYATYVPNDEWDIWKTDGSDCFRLQRNFCPYCGARMDGE